MAVKTIRGRLHRRLLRVALSAAVLTGFAPTTIRAQVADQWQMTNTSIDVDDSVHRQSVRMVINTSREITSNQKFTQIRIQNPEVITAEPTATNRLQVFAKATGITQVDLVGEDNSVHSVQVMVQGDVRHLEAVLADNFPDAKLSIYPVQQGCVISGQVTNAEDIERVVRIAEMYFPEVINNVDVAGVFTIQLETQIMEVSRTKLRELGVDWAFANGDDTISQTVSGLINATGTTFIGTGSETMKIGVIENSTSFFAGIRALRRNNLVKVLSEPKLIAVDGRPASFNSGGEIPIIIPAGLGQVAVQYREFGTRLDYVAKVRGNGRIWLEVRPYVSEVDPSRAVNISGVAVPGFRSRYLETGVEMGAGQTLALAGLLQIKNETINLGLPVLSDMPYLGSLFRSTKEEQNEIELLITVTPNFAGPLDPHEVPQNLPGLGSLPPTDKELYMRGYIESPVVDDCQTCPPGGGVFMGAEENIYMQPSYPGGMQQFPQEGYVPEMIQQPPMPAPNPAAMSVGPNAPKLARQPGRFAFPNNSTTNQGAPAGPGGVPAQSYPSTPVVR